MWQTLHESSAEIGKVAVLFMKERWQISDVDKWEKMYDVTVQVKACNHPCSIALSHNARFIVKNSQPQVLPL